MSAGIEENILLAGAAILLVVLALVVIRSRRPGSGTPSSGSALLPRGLSLKPEPVLTRKEAALYNVLQLVVQDQYLVFPKLPLLRLVQSQRLQGDARVTFVRKVGLKRADFALVHPGELTVAKIVEVDRGDRPIAERTARHTLIDTICKSAGIEVILVKEQASYSVPDLAARLGLGSSDE